MLQALIANRTVIGAAVALAVCGGLYVGGRYHGSQRCEERHRAALVEHLQRAAEQAAEIARQDAELSADTLAVERKIEVRYRTVTEEVVKHVPTDAVCAVSDLGLRLLNGALTNTLHRPADPGKPDGAVPGPGAAAPSDNAGPSGQVDRGVRPVLPMPGPAKSFI